MLTDRYADANSFSRLLEGLTPRYYVSRYLSYGELRHSEFAETERTHWTKLLIVCSADADDTQAPRSDTIRSAKPRGEADSCSACCHLASEMNVDLNT